MTSSLPLVAAVSVAVLIGPAPGSGPSFPDVVQHTAARGGDEQRRVLDYWTPARMAAAVPVGLLGAVGQVGGLLWNPAEPRRQAAIPPAATSGSRWAARGAVTRTTGRVFLTLNGHDFVCSASAVRSASRDLVVTAGHCVKDGPGGWARNWTFVPGYESGSRPYGTYTARRVFVAGPWSRGGDDNYDVALIALNTSGGRHLTDVVGAQDIGFNGRRGLSSYGFGFPADPPYDGRHLMYCAGAMHDDPHRLTNDQGLRCDLTAGSSGGPWLTGFDPLTGRGTVTSVSSFKYSDDQGTMYGPYFGGAIKDLYTAAARA
jgi:V8-like Glu-specific endopeptidase